MAVTGGAYRDVMVAVTQPVWVQRTLFAALGPIGRVLGRRPSYANGLAEVHRRTVPLTATEVDDP